jgi:hypothetical protein
MHLGVGLLRGKETCGNKTLQRPMKWFSNGGLRAPGKKENPFYSKL